MIVFPIWRRYLIITRRNRVSGIACAYRLHKIYGRHRYNIKYYTDINRPIETYKFKIESCLVKHIKCYISMDYLETYPTMTGTY